MYDLFNYLNMFHRVVLTFMKFKTDPVTLIIYLFILLMIKT